MKQNGIATPEWYVEATCHFHTKIACWKYRKVAWQTVLKQSTYPVPQNAIKSLGSFTNAASQDFVQIIKQKVTPCRGRELIAEILHGAHDWKTYYEQYGIYVSGLVPNPHKKDASEMSVNHCWRFVRRADPWHDMPHHKYWLLWFQHLCYVL